MQHFQRGSPTGTHNKVLVIMRDEILRAQAYQCTGSQRDSTPKR
jgi:hypothetical protein